MEKKYRLTDETTRVGVRTLYRIEALIDFCGVRKGDKGGYIESDFNLSHEDNCWVSGDAKVWGNARVYGDARVQDNSRVWGYAEVFENAQLYGNARVCDNAQLYGNARVCDNAKVCSYARVCDNAKVCGDAQVYALAKVSGNADIASYAQVASDADYIVFKNWWSSGRYFTWTRSNDMWRVGCFSGTGDELIDKAYKDSELSGREYERIVKYVEEIKRDGSDD